MSFLSICSAVDIVRTIEVLCIQVLQDVRSISLAKLALQEACNQQWSAVPQPRSHRLGQVLRREEVIEVVVAVVPLGTDLAPGSSEHNVLLSVL